MINCFILGNLDTIRVISGHIELLSLSLNGYSTSFDDGFEAALRKKPDIVYVDNAFKDSHVDELHLLKGQSMVVFLSSNPDDAYEAYEFDVFDFLLAPFSFARFLKGIEKFEKLRKKIVDNKKHTLIDAFYVKIKDKVSREQLIRFSEIVYVEALQNDVRLHLENGAKYVIPYNITEIQEELPENIFKRVHRSFLINEEKINAVKGNKVYLNNDKCWVVIGVTYKKEFTDRRKLLLVKRNKKRRESLFALFPMSFLLGDIWDIWALLNDNKFF